MEKSMKSQSLYKVRFIDIVPEVLKLLPRFPKIIKDLKRASSMDANQRYSIGDVIEENAVQFSEKKALIFEDSSFTYQQFNQIANKYANYFLAEGIKRGDTIVLFMENRPELLFIVAASAKIGAIVSLINPNQRGDVLLHSIELNNARYFIVHNDLLDVFVQVENRISTINHSKKYCIGDVVETIPPKGFVQVEEKLTNVLDTNPKLLEKITVRENFANIFTSGTSGLPKASHQTHRKWLGVYYWFGKIVANSKKDDVIYVPLPFYHTSALILAWPLAFAGGATLVMKRKFSTNEFWHDVKEYNVSMFIYIGEMCRYLLNAPIQPLETNHRISKIIGNGIRPDVWKPFKRRFKIKYVYEFYSASDSNVGFTNTFNLDNTVGWSASKYSIICYDVENDKPILDEQGYFKKVKQGETGLLISEVTEKAQFDGYVNSIENETKLYRNVFKEGDVWFNSGDLMRAIGFGHVQFVDRIGDTFRWKGENVATEEVENIANKLDFVKISAVYGVKIPNNDGKAGMITIIPKENKEVDIKKIFENFINALPDYAVPVFVRISNDLEITHTMKIKKYILQEESINTKDRVFVKTSKTSGYTAMNNEILEKINTGSYVF